MKELPYRQIHLDFHTSPLIPDVGSQFDAALFASTLKQAHVNSVNIFAKCHHGMSYYPTEHGKVHPSLSFDLLGEMVKALKQVDIRAIAYFPVGWEEHSADHSEWLEVPRSGLLGGITPFEDRNYKWRKLCLNKKEYIDQVLLQSAEIMDRYEIDGFWYDIIFQQECVCLDCQRSMKELGLDPKCPNDVMKHDEIVLNRFQERVYTFVKARSPEAQVVFNGNWRPDGGYDPAYSITERKKLQTHIEIESLPSEMWGYNHFPLFVNYHNRANEELVGMNGKFHGSWGDFGSIRNLEALEFECFRMIASGSKCSIGDQMHPRGLLDPVVYKRIGEVFSQIEQREPWCRQSKKVSQIGVLTANRPLQHHSDADEGIMRMLLELHYTFDFLDIRDDFEKYELLILPDHVLCSEELADKLSCYMSNGGKLLASYHSGMDIQQQDFALKQLGVAYLRENDYTPSYLLPDESLLTDEIEAYEYVLYEQGAYVRSSPDAQVLARLGSSYFNRSYDKFCSHRHTPYDAETEHPAIVRNGNAVYIAHPIFTDYILQGPRIYRSIVAKLLQELVRKPIVVSNLPTSAEMTIRMQDSENRLIIHLIHYIAERKARKLDIVDTKIPLYNLNFTIQSPKRPIEVYLEPSSTPLRFHWADGEVTVQVPELNGHAMLVLQY